MRKSSYYYVYIIQSLKDPDRFYTGFSEDLDTRLKAHNQNVHLQKSVCNRRL